MKNCTRCDETKPLSEFNRCSRARDGRRSECRTCQHADDLTYTAQPEVREHRRLVAKDWWAVAENRAAVNARRRRRA